jgi:hypothetical protein
LRPTPHFSNARVVRASTPDDLCTECGVRSAAATDRLRSCVMACGLMQLRHCPPPQANFNGGSAYAAETVRLAAMPWPSGLSIAADRHSTWLQIGAHPLYGTSRLTARTLQAVCENRLTRTRTPHPIETVHVPEPESAESERMSYPARGHNPICVRKYGGPRQKPFLGATLPNEMTWNTLLR